MSSTIPEQSSELRIATFRLARRLRAERADTELSDSQFSVLVWLKTSGPHSLGELATHERVSAPSMNHTVNRLEAAGYVTREGDANDGRRVLIALTARGRELVADTVKKRDAWMSRQLGELRPEERATLAHAAQIMRRIAEA